MTVDTLALPRFPMVRTSPLDPPAKLLELQRTQPLAEVQLHSGQRAWLLTRFDDIKRALTDPRLSADMSLPGYPAVHPTLTHFGEGRLNHMDPPEHDVYRRMLAPEFMVKRVEALRPSITATVESLIDDMLSAGPGTDLVRALAIPVPGSVTCTLLGVPYSKRDFFVSCVDTFLGGESTVSEAQAMGVELRAFFADLVRQKRRAPTADLLSRVAVDYVEAGQLTEEQLVGFAELLLTAGFDTTWNMIALGTLTLLEHPEQLEILKAEPDLVNSTVEELLRFLTVPHLGRHRVATEPIEVHGRTIAPGDGVIAAHNAANRDPSAFDDPDTFDVRRNPRHHLAFGHGIHQCLAATLARVELQVVFSLLFQRIPTLRLAGSIDELEFKHESSVYGVRQLPVTWD